MARGPVRASAPLWGALALVSSAVLVVLLPSLTSASAPQSVTLAVAAAALAALLQREVGSALLATARLGGPSRPVAQQPPPLLTGRATDPVHHPLRPRAPGTV